MKQVVRNIHLYGKLKEMCGGNDVIQMVGDNLRIIASGLSSMFGPEIKQHIKENNWHIIRNEIDLDNFDNNAGNEFTPDMVDMKIGKTQDIHLYPAVEGSGRTVQIIVGVVLIVVGVIVGVSADWTGLGAMAGMSMITMGIGMILSAVFAPKIPGQQEKPDERASFTFNGPVNTMGQGGPVQLIYGRFRSGSAVVSAGINAEQLMSYTSPAENDAVNDYACFINPEACVTP